MKVQDNKRQRILVVEDEAVIRRVCLKVLAGHGFSVDIASDGQKAIDNLDRQHYDLCILDLRMSGIDGIDLFKYLSDNQRGLCQKVVFTTGDITGSQVSRFLHKSERVCLQKPFTPQELLAAVELALN